MLVVSGILNFFLIFCYVYIINVWYIIVVYFGLMEVIDVKDYLNGLKWVEIIQKCVEKVIEIFD